LNEFSSCYRRASRLAQFDIDQATDNDDKMSGENGTTEDGSPKKLPIHLQSAHNRILIKNGTVVNADGSVHADVYVEDA